MSTGVFETFYQSEVQQPILLWIANLTGTLFALRSSRTQNRFIVFWALISALDAWLTANHVYGLGSLPSPLSSWVPFIFVWLGDFRIWIGMESGKVTARSIAACFTVPVLSGILTLHQETRILFLVYESLFLIWVILYTRLTGLDRKPQTLAIRNLSLTFYSLWVLADALILFLPSPSKDLGFAIRVIPNLIYYGAFGLVYAKSKKNSIEHSSDSP